MKRLTERQYRRLLILGSGAIALVPGKRDWMPLLRRGLVAEARAFNSKRKSQFLQPLEITPQGFRVLAECVERYGLPPVPKVEP